MIQKHINNSKGKQKQSNDGKAKALTMYWGLQVTVLRHTVGVWRNINIYFKVGISRYRRNGWMWEVNVCLDLLYDFDFILLLLSFNWINTMFNQHLKNINIIHHYYLLITILITLYISNIFLVNQFWWILYPC